MARILVEPVGLTSLPYEILTRIFVLVVSDHGVESNALLLLSKALHPAAIEALYREIVLGSSKIPSFVAAHQSPAAHLKLSHIHVLTVEEVRLGTLIPVEDFRWLLERCTPRLVIALDASARSSYDWTEMATVLRYPARISLDLFGSVADNLADIVDLLKGLAPRLVSLSLVWPAALGMQSASVPYLIEGAIFHGLRPLKVGSEALQWLGSAGNIRSLFTRDAMPGIVELSLAMETAVMGGASEEEVDRLDSVVRCGAHWILQIHGSKLQSFSLSGTGLNSILDTLPTVCPALGTIALPSFDHMGIVHLPDSIEVWQIRWFFPGDARHLTELFRIDASASLVPNLKTFVIDEWHGESSFTIPATASGRPSEVAEAGDHIVPPPEEFLRLQKTLQSRGVRLVVVCVKGADAMLSDFSIDIPAVLSIGQALNQWLVDNPSDDDVEAIPWV